MLLVAVGVYIYQSGIVEVEQQHALQAFLQFCPCRLGVRLGGDVFYHDIVVLREPAAQVGYLLGVGAGAVDDEYQRGVAILAALRPRLGAWHGHVLYAAAAYCRAFLAACLGVCADYLRAAAVVAKLRHAGWLHEIGKAEIQLAQLALHGSHAVKAPEEHGISVIAPMLIDDIARQAVCPRRLDAEAAAVAYPAEPYENAFYLAYVLHSANIRILSKTYCFSQNYLSFFYFEPNFRSKLVTFAI